MSLEDGAMTNLSEFLHARIAEDEAVARSTGGQPWSATVPGMVHADGGFRIKSRYVAGVEHDEDRAHIARHNPARVLAECDAKRRIVNEHDHVPAVGYATGGFGCVRCSLQEGVIEPDGWCLTLRALALPYADHPDYDPAWRT